MAERKQTSRVADLLRKSVEAVAEKKANANCFGFMYAGAWVCFGLGAQKLP